MSSSKALRTTLRFSFIPIFGLEVLYNLVEQFLNRSLLYELQSPEGIGPRLYLIAATSVFCGVVFPGLQMMSFARPLTSQEGWFSFAGHHIEQLVIESLRSWGFILLGFIGLILPGILLALLFCFVPMVVLFLREYNEGRVDALKASVRIARARWLTVSITLILGVVVFPALLSSTFDEYSVFWKTPVSALFVSLLESLVVFTQFFILFALFIPTAKELGYEPILQLERT